MALRPGTPPAHGHYHTRLFARADEGCLTKQVSRLEAQLAISRSETADVLAKMAQMKEEFAQNKEESLLQGSEEAKLVVADFEIHEYVKHFPAEPAVPCITADKAVNMTLCFKNKDGELATPPKDFKVEAALHLEGSDAPLAATDIKWLQRSKTTTPRGIIHKKWDGRILRLDVGDLKNTFEMSKPTMKLQAFIHPYYSEINNRTVHIRFSPVKGRKTTMAFSPSVRSMSRLPKSRKKKAPLAQKEPEATISLDLLLEAFEDEP